MSEQDQKGAPAAPRFFVEVKDVQGHADGRFELTAVTKKQIVGATEDMLAAVRNAVTDVCHMAYGAFQAADIYRREQEHLFHVAFPVPGDRSRAGW